MSTDSTPVEVQESIISASLNTSMLFNFMMGIYTMVYAGTLYLYMSKKTVNINRRIVVSAISVLYLFCISDFILQWYFLDWAIVINGDVRESIFISALEGGPVWFGTLNAFLLDSLYVVSDGLLIWRCYHVWGQSFRIISVLLILFLAEFTLFVSVIIFAALYAAVPSPTNVALFNHLTSALVFMSLGTTAISTFLIGYRIYSTSRTNGSPSKRLFDHIVVLVIESAAAYSLVVFLEAVIIVVPSFTVLGSPWYHASYYVNAVLVFVQGMAPTVLVARIALTNPKTTVAPTITHISGLQFGSQQGSGRSGRTTGGEFNASIHTGDVVLPPVVEVKKESSVDSTFGGYQV